MLSLEAQFILSDFADASALLTEVKGEEMSWFRKGSEQEDELVVEANSVIFDALANADVVREIEAETGRNLREQLTVEEVMEMERESKLRGWGVGRN